MRLPKEAMLYQIDVENVVQITIIGSKNMRFFGVTVLLSNLDLHKITIARNRRAYGTVVSTVVLHLNLIHLNHSQILAIHKCILVYVPEQYPVAHVE